MKRITNGMSDSPTQWFFSKVCIVIFFYPWLSEWYHVPQQSISTWRMRQEGQPHEKFSRIRITKGSRWFKYVGAQASVAHLRALSYSSIHAHAMWNAQTSLTDHFYPISSVSFGQRFSLQSDLPFNWPSRLAHHLLFAGFHLLLRIFQSATAKLAEPWSVKVDPNGLHQHTWNLTWEHCL